MQNFIELKFCILFYDEALHCIIYIEILEKIMKIKKNRAFSYAVARWLLTNRVNGTNRRKMKRGEL